jgi:hypothetical protein
MKRTDCLPLLAFLSIALFPGFGWTENGWPFEFRAGLFNVHADYDPQSLRSPEMSSTLANLPDEIAKALGIELSGQEVHLILFQKATVYREYLSKHFPGVVPRQAMFIRRGGPGMVFAYESDQLATDLRHESTALATYASSPNFAPFQIFTASGSCGIRVDQQAGGHGCGRLSRCVVDHSFPVARKS